MARDAKAEGGGVEDASVALLAALQTTQGAEAEFLAGQVRRAVSLEGAELNQKTYRQYSASARIHLRSEKVAFQVEDLDVEAAGRVHQAEHQARQEGWSGNLASVLFKERAEEKEEEEEAKELEKLKADESDLQKQMEEEKKKEIDKSEAIGGKREARTFSIFSFKSL